MDIFSIAKRREIMRAVRREDTAPEMVVRRLLHRLGFRYRLHAKDLPGSPDVVFRSRRKAIFIHGCFWHGHDCGKGGRPKSRSDYWNEKIRRNTARDTDRIDSLSKQGWNVLVVWECETRKRNEHALTEKLCAFLA